MAPGAERVADVSALRFGFGTNGFANHRLDDALTVLSDLGYDGVALTLDHAHLDPFAPDLSQQLRWLAGRLATLGLAVVVETGARYLLDPWRKHEPTLVDPEGRGRRLDLLHRAVVIAAELGAESMSFWSGARRPDVASDFAWQLLADGCAEVLDHAERDGVTLGLEPEPGMFVEDLAGYEHLAGILGRHPRFGLTLDIGHCRCLEVQPVDECVRRGGERIVNVQIDDMRRGVHEHLELGTGEVDFPPVLAALDQVGYRGLIAVELPRHSHAAPIVAAESLRFLRAYEESTSSRTCGNQIDTRLRAALLPRLSSQGQRWLVEAERSIAEHKDAIHSLFPQVARRCGREPMGDALPGWTVDDAVRAWLLTALPLRGKDLVAEVSALYRYGDIGERRGVLRALSLLDTGDDALSLVHDALRSNDTRLVAAALGPYAAAHLDDHSFRQAVLKCVFTGIPLAQISGIETRADRELSRMLVDYAHERIAAGRDVPEDVWRVVDRLPNESATAPTATSNLLAAPQRVETAVERGRHEEA